jgi:ABC-type Fe3+/spermidine/putrescine transport system ATPase subunit
MATFRPQARATRVSEPSAAPFLAVNGLSKSFGHEAVLRDVTFTLAERQTLSVLGRSGCGKTTLLKALAGLHELDQGSVHRRGQDITAVPVEKRDIVYIYQEPLLFPHLSVFENVAFGLRLRKADRARIDRDVAHMLTSLDLFDQRDKAPHTLSGGQRQRVSFGRALIVSPELLLLDEPFSSLDTETRAQMQALFKKVAAEYAITAIFVTHDLKEALLVGDAFASIRGGRFRAYANRQEFIDDPESGVRQEAGFWRSLEGALP